MPTYVHTCHKCSLTFDDIRSARFCSDPAPCPLCGQNCARDWEAEAKGRLDPSGEGPEELSEAAGVHPSQIAENQARFPHHEFAPDGRMRFRNRSHKARCLKDLGYTQYTKRDLKSK